MLIWFLGAALAGECETVRFKDIVSIEPPAVIVLGERHGHQPDLRRADRVVAKLAKKHPVRVGIEAVHRDKQAVLDRYAGGDVMDAALPVQLDWDNTWGFDWRPYRRLVTASVYGAEVVGAGLDLGPKPDEAEVALPPSYMDLLRPALGGHELPLGGEARFVQSMAWRDFSIADATLGDWDGQGYAVIVTGRGHVEGGKGVNWQAARLTDAPVHSFVLKSTGDDPCHPGDRLWR